MDDLSRARLQLLQGGTSGDLVPPARSRAELRVIAGGKSPELELALAEAVEAARQIRREIESRIARALASLDDR